MDNPHTMIRFDCLMAAYMISINVADADARELSIFTNPIVKRPRKKPKAEPLPQGDMTRQQRRAIERKKQKQR